MRRLCLALLSLAAICAAGAAVAGELRVAHFRAASLGRDWTYEIYLPTGYDATARRYPVIFLLHGVSDDPTVWQVKAGIVAMADRLIASGALQPSILVMPAAGRSWYVDGPEKMETAFAGDLLPEIDRIWRTEPQRQARTIAGISMGGYGAMRLALRHPDRFSAVALLSPAIYAPEPPPISAARISPAFQAGGNFDGERWRRLNYPALLDDFVRSGWRLRVQLTAGTGDRYDTGAAARHFAAALQARGRPAEIALFPGAHDWSLWRTTLPLALRFLGGPPQVAQAAAPRPPAAAAK